MKKKIFGWICMLAGIAWLCWVNLNLLTGSNAYIAEHSDLLVIWMVSGVVVFLGGLLIILPRKPLVER